MSDDTTNTDLPPLSDARVRRIEDAVFAEIVKGRPQATAPSVRARSRRRNWLTGAGIAAAFVAGVLITPPILTSVGGSGSSSTADGAYTVTQESGPESAVGSADRSLPGSVSDEAEMSTVVPGAAEDVNREIIANANATVEVDDISAAADAVAALAESRGGYVESTEVGKSVAVDGASAPMPADPGYGWISIRVPSADLTAVIDALSDTGDVVSSSVTKQDVTSTAIDLRARVDATRASVQRLTELMSQSGTVAELIEAEVALTDRQAQLESYEQQLTALEDQVSMSSLQVQLTRTAEPTTADPAGFGDGLLAGWNGLVVSLNAVVIAAGFLLPWLALAGVVVLVVWLIRRARRTRRAVAEPRSEE
ncbi:DUF4349 domain-containing protein [Microbacterium sp. 3J1]|uniref:DUF4349 domain-containing protein n=1 Tax=Microbacterium sp. 3J1 TaxID=861269 RepID=UPI000A4937AD|nr:DUF4349 domain-containing protein [Microbacterium sp. 3J1]